MGHGQPGLDSIAVSLFVFDLVEFDKSDKSDNKIEISILILRRGAMANLGLTLAFLPKASERSDPTSSGNHDHLSYKTLNIKYIV